MENASNVCHLHYVGEILKRNNHRSFEICVLRKTQAAKSRDYQDTIFFEKRRFQIVFPCTLKCKAGDFKFLRFEERFRKSAFSGWIIVDGRPSRVFNFFRRSVDAAWTRRGRGVDAALIYKGRQQQKRSKENT